ncbi:MAG: hypothetical protein E1N59_1537 [Puniceicoccaceae bacterium 5H]|nr:MAG: hypothetical protein E1N59_1537 [Puniceicoccaceae bacterium 5H]
MKPFSILALWFAVVGVSAADQLSQTRQLIDRWVETERLIAQEKVEAEQDIAMLQSTRDLLQQRIEAVRAEIDHLESAQDVSGEQRVELREAQAQQQEMSDALVEALASYELQLKNRYSALPSPLQERLRAQFRQLPNDPAHTRATAGERLQTVLSILEEVARFNETITVAHEIRTRSDGTRIQADTVYWGLAFALSASVANDEAYLGRPQANGPWQFEPLEGRAAAHAFELVRMADGSNGDVHYVSFPVPVPIPEKSEGQP